MKFTFKAKIYKVGINLCVKVPLRITKTMEATKGYIRVKGTIEGFKFHQTLVPVKDNPYRLFVNGSMLKDSNMRNGKTATFELEQDHSTLPRPDSAMTKEFRTQLTKANVLEAFKQLTLYRQKEIIRYLYYLKSDESKNRNMKKVIGQLKTKKPARIP